MKFQYYAQKKKSYDYFPQVACLECNSELCKKVNFLRSYLRKYSTKGSKIQTQCSGRFQPKWVLFLASEMSHKISYSKNAMMTYLEQRNPNIQSYDTKCYETNSQKDREDRSTP